MCCLSHSSTRKKIKGYKIVARKPKGKIYFSMAMGFKYPSDGHIPIVKKQRSIYLEMAKDLISEDSGAYKTEMIGRTSVFIYFRDAQVQCYHWQNYVEKGYQLVVVQSEVSKDIMTGYYGVYKVAAGRHIHFIKEIKI